MFEGWLADVDMFDSDVDEPNTHNVPQNTAGAVAADYDGVDALYEDDEELQLWADD